MPWKSIPVKACETCMIDISLRGGQARFCKPCYHKREMDQQRVYRESRRVKE